MANWWDGDPVVDQPEQNWWDGDQVVEADEHHPEFDPANVPANQPSRITAALSSAVEGIPVAGPYLQSGVEHVASGIDSWLSGKPRAEILQEMRGDVDRAQKAYPITSAAAGLGGAALGLAPLAATGPGAAALGITGRNLGARMLAGGLSGSAIGGADSAVRSDGDAWETGKGALVGGALGLGGPVAGDVIGAGARRGWQWLSAPTQGAERKIVEALQADGLTAAQARQKLQDLGPDAMVADLGPNLSSDAAAIASAPGRGQTVLREGLERRATSAPQRLKADANASLGQTTDAIAARDAMVQQRAQQAAPLYQKAYSEPFAMTNAQKNILKVPAGKTALAKAQRLAANEGIPLNADALDVRGIDLVKRSFDDQIEVAKRAGRGNEARILIQMKDRFIKDAPQSYKDALDAFSGQSQIIDALDSGQSLFSRKVPAGQVKADMSAMSKGERDAFIQGARSQLEEIMANSANDALAVRKMFRQEGNRRKLALVLGPKEAARFLNSLAREETFANTAYKATGNSETAARQAAQQRWGIRAGQDTQGAIESAGNLNFGSAVRKAVGKVGGNTASKAAEAERAKAARLLSSNTLGPLGRLEAIFNQGRIAGDTAGSLAHLGTLGLGTRIPLELTVTRRDQR